MYETSNEKGSWKKNNRNRKNEIFDKGTKKCKESIPSRKKNNLIITNISQT